MNYLYSALKWKESLDEAVVFMDGMRLPCLYVENKRDLVKKKKKEDSEQLKEFAKNNGFIGCFRTSAKTGKKVYESMDFIIKNVINRMEQMMVGTGKELRADRRSVQLDPKIIQELKMQEERKRKIVRIN